MIPFYKVFFITLIGSLPILGWWIFLVFRKKKRRGFFSQKDFEIIFLAGIWSVLIAFLLEIILLEKKSEKIVLNFLFNYWPFENKVKLAFLPNLIPIFLWALSEEIAKTTLILWGILVRKIRHGVFLGVVIGLSFGVTENGVYLVNFLKQYQVENSLKVSSFFLVASLRFLISTSAHIAYSGLAGKILISLNEISNNFKKVLSILIALLFATFVHFFFNLTLAKNVLYLGVILIMSILLFLFREEKKCDELK